MPAEFESTHVDNDRAIRFAIDRPQQTSQINRQIGRGGQRVVTRVDRGAAR